MLLLVSGFVILLLPVVVAFHYKKSAARLRAADEVWGTVESHAHALLQDRTLNVEVGDLAEYMLKRAGDGYLTRSFLTALVLRKRSPKLAHNPLEDLTPGQEKQFGHFAVSVLLYDSLRTSFSGFIIRRVAYWMAGTASDKTASVSIQQIEPMVLGAERKVLQAAC